MTIPTRHPFPFDPTHGTTLAQLRALRPPEPPPGFAAFWRDRHAAARRLDPAPRLGPADTRQHPDWHVHDLDYTSTGGTVIRGWLLRPAAGAIRRALVVGHGYGGRDAPDFDVPVAEAALLFPCFRGLGRSAAPPISQDPAFHVLHDIGDRDRYIIGGCVDDLTLAVSALLALHPELERVGYSGISFGGGIGALALPFDERIDRGHLTVPTFGNMPLWLTLASVGSAASVQNHLRTHPGIRETLRFFDAATAATYLRIPTLVAAARFDPAVAPPCQFSIANARPAADHHETFVLDAGHVEYDGMQAQQAQLAERVRELFEAG